VKDPLDKLVRDIKGRAAPRKVHKATRTMSLAEPEFTIFQRYCRSKGVAHSEVIDSLVASFLLRVLDDLPPEDQTTVKKNNS
jgi:hypothetical protein